MSFDSLKQNIEYLKKITREIYIFTNQLEIIKNVEMTSKTRVDSREKKLLEDILSSLFQQLKIINNTIPEILGDVGGFSPLSEKSKKNKLVQIKYKPLDLDKKISLVITEKDRKEFLENLSRSNLSFKKLKKSYVVPRHRVFFGKPTTYAKISNKLFKKTSNKLISKGYFIRLNRNLRKMNSPYILGTYVSMLFFTTLLVFFAGILITLFLLFFKVGFAYPFIEPVTGSLFLRFVKIFWVIIATPLFAGFLFYFYPFSEAKSIGNKIDKELLFVVIHLSAISTSGIEPTNIFKIIIKSEEYKYTNIEFKKLLNLINFHGKDLVSALKEIAVSSSSVKLRELLNGFATTITTGGNLYNYLNKHTDRLLFEYRLQREKATKNAETFMDIYIAVVIAAPMILMLLFVIMGALGGLGSFLGLSTTAIALLIILIIALLNIIFLAVLKLRESRM